MNCFVRLIGVIDKQDEIDSLLLKQGLNIITGKSSTGKSALIEIFDFCFASSDFTIPEGVITAHARIYFTVFEMGSRLLILGRNSDEKCFLREEALMDPADLLKILSLAFFSTRYAIPLADFKKELNRYFGISMSEIDTLPSELRGKRNPTPSIRSFSSFFLQHQNLIANKHALFYRFDEKEKKEQAIDHFKIFMGLVDQHYFLMSQRRETLQNELRRINAILPKREQHRKDAIGRIDHHLKEYRSIVGSDLMEGSPEAAVSNPAVALDRMREKSLRINAAISDGTHLRQDLDKERSLLWGKIRETSLRRDAAQSTVNSSQGYGKLATSILIPEGVEIKVGTCPFCEQTNYELENQANRLSEAITWLNGELRWSSFQRESFEVEITRYETEIASLKAERDSVQHKIDKIDRETRELKKGKSVDEIALRTKIKIESILEELIDKSRDPLIDQKTRIEEDLKVVKHDILQYDADSKIRELEKVLEADMQDIGRNFDFEDSYHPIQLRFSLETFDLWHQAATKKIYLRSMGSGANWLYCHLTLFLALNRLFCRYANDGCKIPPILFIDQPSQVYFPNYEADSGTDFDAKRSIKADRSLNVDDDLKSVEKFYREILRYCQETKSLTGVEPQIIVTDHADHLNLGEGQAFEDFVRARWRLRGFIDAGLAQRPL